MTLESYRQNGWLHKHQGSAEEIRNLLGVADTKISDYQSWLPPGTEPHEAGASTITRLRRWNSRLTLNES